MLDLNKVVAEAYGGISHTVRLSANSLALLLDTDQLISAHWNWTVGDEPPTDAEFDDIDALVAKAQQELMTDMGNPIGTMFPTPLANLPDGALLCDGATYARVDYPDLYALLDATYIVDPDHFKLPDCRGRVILGAGQGFGLSNYAFASIGGKETHILSTAEMPTHSHGVTDPRHSHAEGIASPAVITIGAGAPTPVGIPGVGVTGVAFTGISIQNAGSSGAHENRQPYIALKWAIWAR